MKKRAAFYSVVLTMVSMGLILAAFAVVNAAVQTIYVNGPSPSSADIPDCGTLVKPCKTIQYAINKATGNGTVINVAKGTYTENLNIDKGKISLVGTEGSAVTFIVAKTNTLPAIKIFGAQLIGVSGFTVRGGGNEAAIFAAMSSLELKNSIVEKSSGKGIALVGSSVGQLTGVTVRSHPRLGIHVSTNSFLRAYPTTVVTANGGDGIEIRKNGSAEIEKCTISSNGGYGVNIAQNSSCALKSCTIKQNLREGVWVAETSSAELRGNNISYNKQSGVNVAQASSASLQGGNIISYNGDPTKIEAWRCGLSIHFLSQVIIMPNTPTTPKDQIVANNGPGVFLGGNCDFFMPQGIINNNRGDGVKIIFNSSAQFGTGTPLIPEDAQITNNDGFGIRCTDRAGDSKYSGTPFFGNPQSNKLGATSCQQF